MKPWKGEIHDWHREYYKDGYVVVGKPRFHPEFSSWIRTSRVLNMTELPRHREDHRRFVIETLNSHYELVGEERETS